jgi:sodium pump decarboxylase gamma subunit
MNRKGIITSVIFAVIMSFTAFSQGRLDMRFNEVMVQNDSSYVDQYGKHTAWIELFNSSYGKNEIAKMYLTNTKVPEGKKVTDLDPSQYYQIPRGDDRTVIQPRKHVVFFADGDNEAGTFHLPFKLLPGKDNYIALYDVNGKTLVDEVVVPATLPADNSFALKLDGKSKMVNGNFDPTQWEVRNGKTELTAITPNNYNTRDVNENIEKFYTHDRAGIIITVIAMLIVFLALILLYLFFKLFGIVSRSVAEKQEAAKVATSEEETNATATTQGGDDEVLAAIFMALYQHLNAHDNESGVLTFNRENEEKSAWSSKINTLRKLPERK